MFWQAGLTSILVAALVSSPASTWSMDTDGGVVADESGTKTMNLSGGWTAVAGQVGGAVAFTAAPATGVVSGSQSDNPAAEDFALGAVFTSNPIPSRKYSGNVVQKGLYGDPGQVKLQLVPANYGTANCRIKGTLGARIISSSVNVDDGRWHHAVCWREGTTVGITVDGVTTSQTWDPGSVANARPITIGNRSATGAAKDQHFGRNDCTYYARGAGARAAAHAVLTGSC